MVDQFSAVYFHYAGFKGDVHYLQLVTGQSLFAHQVKGCRISKEFQIQIHPVDQIFVDSENILVQGTF